MKKIKVLFIGYGTNLGGIETYLFNLVKNADLSKFEFSFLTFKGSKEVVFYNELINMGCKIYKITPRTKNYFKFLKELKDVYKNNSFDYIHFNLMDLSCFERITYANKYSNAKLIIHSHCGSSEGLEKMSFISQKLHKIGLKKIKKIPHYNVACGKKAGIWMHGTEPFLIFNNGIDLNKFKYSNLYREKIRKELNIKKEDICIGLVAKLEVQKNPLFLLEIFKEYYKMNDKSHLVLIGEGSLKDELEAKIKEWGLNTKVHLLGKRIDAYKYYSAFDLVVMPSLFEGLSITLCEAQVNGLKCYTSEQVDRSSNISGNVSFLSLDLSPYEWANYINNHNNERDINVLSKIPDSFNAKKSYEVVYEFYKYNLK